jgi:transposase InsO family protein
MKFAFVHAEKASFPVAALCRLLGVTRQGYYAFVHRPVCARVTAEQGLRERLQELHVETEGRYGSPRMQRALQAEGVRVGKRRIERAMQSLGIHARPRRRFRVTTAADPSHTPAENLLARDFTASGPDERNRTADTVVTG